jgi:hypothetical protein
MKKIALAALIGLMLVTMVIAVKPEDPGKAHNVYLYEKTNFCYSVQECDGDVHWTIVPDGAWGKLMYKDEDDKFVFNGHGLAAGTDYVLISYKEGYPGKGSAVLGRGTSDEFGNVHIADALPELIINNYGTGTWGDYQNVSGTKIWLVLDADFQGEEFVAWNPTDYLFEANLI